jgi:hypothetical protein
MTSPVVTWNSTTVNGIDCLVIDMAQLIVPLDFDPSSNMFLAVGVPSGGYANLPVLLQGNPGDTPTFDSVVNLTVLAYTDPTPNSATLTPLGGDAYQVNLTMHAGAPGATGTSVLNLSAYGTPQAGDMLVVDPTATTVVYQGQMVGDSYWPATILGAPTGNPTFTVAVVPVPGQKFAWRPQVSGQTVITGTGSNVQANFVARIGGSGTGFPICGQGIGPVGTNSTGQHTVISSGPPAGSLTAYNTVAAGVATNIYFNVERQSDTNYFTTAPATTYGCQVTVQPIPGTGTP